MDGGGEKLANGIVLLNGLPELNCPSPDTPKTDKVSFTQSLLMNGLPMRAQAPPLRRTVASLVTTVAATTSGDMGTKQTSSADISSSEIATR